MFRNIAPHVGTQACTEAIKVKKECLQKKKKNTINKTSRQVCARANLFIFTEGLSARHDDVFIAK